MSQLIDCTDPAGHDEAVRLAASAVARGELVVLPTDTVYGVGADAFDGAAVASLLDAKGRGREMPPPVLVPNRRTIDGLAAVVPEAARRLVDRYWPGPLTVVLQAQASLMWDLGETNGTVALRMPDDDLALRLLAETGPLAVSSANRSGSPAATRAEEAQEMLGDAVAVYLDGGPSRGGLASTIVDCTREELVVLRGGALTEREIRAVASGGAERDEPGAAHGDREDLEGRARRAGGPGQEGGLRDTGAGGDTGTGPDATDERGTTDTTDTTDATGGEASPADPDGGSERVGGTGSHAATAQVVQTEDAGPPGDPTRGGA